MKEASPPELAHFYHVYAAGAWEVPVAEHLDALAQARFDGPLYIGLIGDPDQRAAVCTYLSDRLDRPYVTIDADWGYEQVTLHVLWQYAQASAGAVMYAHTKGAYHVDPDQDDWRQIMTRKVILAWRDHLRALDTVDASGFSWVANGRFFAGNFWLANCTYLRTLPEPSNSPREAAERWIGRQWPVIAHVTDPAVRVICVDQVGDVRSLASPKGVSP